MSLQDRIYARIKNSKIPLLVTFGFFLVTIYIAFVHHNYWTVFDQDGLIYLQMGRAIISGNSENVALFDAGPGGPVLFALLEKIFGDAFSAIKMISILSGSGIVFFSYYITRNIFDYKVAIVVQLFVAFNPWIGIFSTQALNELLPIFFVFVSLYFITKKELKLYNIILIGTLLGIAFMFRYQSMIILFAIIVFLLIRNREFGRNFIYIGVLISLFLISFSPVIFYNYSTYGILMQSDSNFYLAHHAKYQTEEWKNQLMESIGEGSLKSVLIDPALFMKNYFYNLFFGTPNNLFGFENKVSASIIPALQVFGIIPVFGSLIYLLKIKLDKITIISLLGTTSITALLVLLLGEIQIHFFALFIMPMISLVILNFKKITNNLKPILILPVIFVLIMSIVPLRAPQHFLMMWISIAILSSVFFVKAIPKIYHHFTTINNKYNSELLQKGKIFVVVMVSIILIINFGYSFITFVTISTGYPFTNIDNLSIMLSQPINQRELEVKQISEILLKQPRIQDSYIMAAEFTPVYYSGSKWIPTFFNEGPENDTVENFIIRKNWKKWELYISDASGVDALGKFRGIPDYLIFVPPKTPSKIHKFLKVLENPNDPRIPANFELLYKSEKTGTVVYKIQNQK